MQDSTRLSIIGAERARTGAASSFVCNTERPLTHVIDGGDETPNLKMGASIALLLGLIIQQIRSLLLLHLRIPDLSSALLSKYHVMVRMTMNGDGDIIGLGIQHSAYHVMVRMTINGDGDITG